MYLNSKAKKSKNHSPLPWAHRYNGECSGVVDAMECIVCGSLICRTTPQDLANHKLIVNAVNAFIDGVPVHV